MGDAPVLTASRWLGTHGMLPSPVGRPRAARGLEGPKTPESAAMIFARLGHSRAGERGGDLVMRLPLLLHHLLSCAS